MYRTRYEKHRHMGTIKELEDPKIVEVRHDSPGIEAQTLVAQEATAT